jgi:hypothetical protein
MFVLMHFLCRQKENRHIYYFTVDKNRNIYISKKTGCFKMAINYWNLGATGVLLGKYAFNNGLSQVKNEFDGARYSATKNGSSIDTLIQTHGMGDFELKIMKNLRGDYDLDEANYYSGQILFGKPLGKLDVYKKTNQSLPAVSNSPFKYKITTKNNNTDIKVFVNYGILKGSVKMRVGPDKTGAYQVKKVTVYDGSGRVWRAYVAPQKNPWPSSKAPAAPASIPPAKPSP